MNVTRPEERQALPRGRRPLMWTLRAAVACALVLSSAGLLYGVARSVGQARELADRALESTAASLAAALEHALRSAGPSEAEAVLSDRVVAYALVVSPQGSVLLHTNPDLVGTALPAREVAAWLAPGRPWGRRVLLGTGTPAYEYFYAVHPPSGDVEVLRLVIHAAGAEAVVARAQRLWWWAGGLVALLWASGVALERIATRQVRLQDELDRRGRLALVGQMTATLAHEIRNALGGIKGFAQWVDERTPVGDPRKPGLGAVLQGASRVEGLVDGLLGYAREETYRVDPVDLASAARDAADAALAGWPGALEVDIDRSTPAVRGDRPKLVAALINGLRNAREAAGDQGTIRMAATPAGRWVELSVEDSGPGLAPEAETQLFTPFFTTKASGTGLGLAYSKKVVEGMGGTIRLTNRKSGGAALVVRLARA